jgi:deoxyribodipyrimidine photolyase
LALGRKYFAKHLIDFDLVSQQRRVAMGQFQWL